MKSDPVRKITRCWDCQVEFSFQRIPSRRCVECRKEWTRSSRRKEKVVRRQSNGRAVQSVMVSRDIEMELMARQVNRCHECHLVFDHESLPSTWPKNTQIADIK